MPEFFHSKNEKELRKCGVSCNKAKALVSIREACDDGLLSEKLLMTMVSKDRSKHLQSIWGVGPWTADMASIFYFSDPDI